MHYPWSLVLGRTLFRQSHRSQYRGDTGRSVNVHHVSSDEFLMSIVGRSSDNQCHLHD